MEAPPRDHASRRHQWGTERAARTLAALHHEDPAVGFGGSGCRNASYGKFPSAFRDWRDKGSFPLPLLWKNETTEGRHHNHETNVRHAGTRAVRSSGIDKRASCHTFRRPFASRVRSPLDPPDEYPFRQVSTIRPDTPQSQEPRCRRIGTCREKSTRFARQVAPPESRGGSSRRS